MCQSINTGVGGGDCGRGLFGVSPSPFSLFPACRSVDHALLERLFPDAELVCCCLVTAWL